jgi:hypothetical protein
MIIDDLPFEPLWRLWIEDSEICNCSIVIFIHAKYPERIRSSWVKQHLIPYDLTLRPEWGSLKLTEAMIHLLHSAIIDNTYIDYFTFASESCLPIFSIAETISRIQTEHCSWVNYGNKAVNGYSAQSQVKI